MLGGELPTPQSVWARLKWLGLDKDVGLRISPWRGWIKPTLRSLPAVTLWLLEIPSGNSKTIKYKSIG